MTKIQEISFHATFLVPTYDLGDKTRFITTQNAYSIDDNVSKSIDVWLVQAIEGRETESMLKSLRKEQLNGERAIKSAKKDTSLSEDERDKRIAFLRRYAKLMKQYLTDYDSGNMQHNRSRRIMYSFRENFFFQMKRVTQSTTHNIHPMKDIHHCQILNISSGLSMKYWKS
jgi:hypothetical protein